MFKIKDLNHKLSEFLPDKDLLNLSLINKYSYIDVFNEEYWKRKFFNEYANEYIIQFNIYNESWKKYYFLIRKWLNEEDHITSINFTIHEDRSDLLQMIYIKNKYNKSNPIYGWHNQGRNFLDPMTEIIETDAIQCFVYIYEPAKHYNYILVKNVILIHSHKILNYLSNYIKKDHIYLILKHNCDKCTENLKLEKYANYEFLNNIENYKRINEVYNKLFHDIVKKIENIDQFKSQALHENKFDMIKALTKYTSQFSDFVIENQ